ncbi:MAG: hypothetical protein K8I27_04760 [Planctomycetes bacterium]|nr:hypothetical protein [Planctomycetota bacterium]
MTRWFPLLTLLIAFATPLWAVKVKLKTEDKEFEADIIRVYDGEVFYRKGRKEYTAPLEDFETGSQFLVMQSVAGADGESLLDLARFALHRGLFKEARETADRAAKLDGFTEQAQRISDVAYVLEGDALLDEAIAALDEKNAAKARPLLERVIAAFADTPAAVKAEILLGTLNRVELEVKAAELEKLAKEAQADADAEERKKRAPIDDWLSELEVQVGANEDIKKEADQDCIENQVLRALPKYENVVKAMQSLRKSLMDSRYLLTFRGQDGHADRIDGKARRLIIECYYQWAYQLYKMTRYDVAATVCKHGIEMDPRDRRFLSLKVDIDDMYDPLED